MRLASINPEASASDWRWNRQYHSPVWRCQERSKQSRLTYSRRANGASNSASYERIVRAVAGDEPILVAMPFADDGNEKIERRGTHLWDKARPNHFGNEAACCRPVRDINPTTPRQRPLSPKVLPGWFYSPLSPTAIPLAPSKADYDRQFGIDELVFSGAKELVPRLLATWRLARCRADQPP
jgi:hypothetical protein